MGISNQLSVLLGNFDCGCALELKEEKSDWLTEYFGEDE